MEDSKLVDRILDIAYENNLSHLGSYLSSVSIIDKIYSEKESDDIFILFGSVCCRREVREY